MNTLIDTESIAIVSMGCRYPGCGNPSEFWHNIRHGVESLVEFTDEEILASGTRSEFLTHPDYVKCGVTLNDIDLFDANFFGYSPREAELIDPQHRLFLQCAFETLESAGYDPGKFDGRIGIYGGSGTADYCSQTFCAAKPACGEVCNWNSAIVLTT